MSSGVGRREILALLASLAIARSDRVRAQQAGRVYRVAFLAPFPRNHPFWSIWFDELRRYGFVEGQNLAVDPRGFGVPVANYDAVAATLVANNPDVIVPLGPEADRAVQAATHNVPIVAGIDDPVASKLAESLSHPGGNLTGVALFATQLDSKRLEVLHEAVPGAKRIGILADPGQTASWPQLHQAGDRLGVELAFFNARSGAEIAAAIDAMAAAHMEAVNILASPVLGGAVPLEVENLRRVKLPAMYQWPDSVTSGGLIGYGPRNDDISRLAVQQLVRVLKGEKPSDIPIVQPTNFELAINLKTAHALGLAIPGTLLARADRVIE
ncbi:MAG TPA: ABC transporter substrate-binding protein [Stellaceae bacterium]|nr:ABC transporter substrate-binding protein [Stellaceae bacterium]